MPKVGAAVVVAGAAHDAFNDESGEVEGRDVSLPEVKFVDATAREENGQPGAEVGASSRRSSVPFVFASRSKRVMLYPGIESDVYMIH